MVGLELVAIAGWVQFKQPFSPIAEPTGLFCSECEPLSRVNYCCRRIASIKVASVFPLAEERVHHGAGGVIHR